jgi:AAA domain
MIRDGKGQGVPLRYNADFKSRNLSQAQRATVDSLLGCRDQFSALSGSSGVGKTYGLVELIKANQASGAHVAVVAPSDAARDIIRREGAEFGYSAEAKALVGAVSLQMWQADPRLHEKLGKGDLLIIDEASFVSLGQGHLELSRARKQGYRVLFTGDLDQKKSIEAGDFLRLAIGAGVHTSELHEIRRQSETALDGHYKTAVKLLKQGRTNEAFAELDKAGCIVELKGKARVDAIADDLLRSEAQGIPALSVNISHRENDNIARAVRLKMGLRRNGFPMVVYGTCGWTDAQKKDFKLPHCAILEVVRGADKGSAWSVDTYCGQWPSGAGGERLRQKNRRRDSDSRSPIIQQNAI